MILLFLLFEAQNLRFDLLKFFKSFENSGAQINIQPFLIKTFFVYSINSMFPLDRHII